MDAAMEQYEGFENHKANSSPEVWSGHGPVEPGEKRGKTRLAGNS